MSSTPFSTCWQPYSITISSSTMISEKNFLYDELRASEEALLPNDEIDVPLPLAPCSRSRWIIKSISKHLHRAHSKINYRLAVIQVLLITIYTVVFITLQSQMLPNDNGALIPCECVERSRSPLEKLTRPCTAPARSAVQMERRTLHNSVNVSNPYKGPPSPELDLAWHNLLRRTVLPHACQNPRGADLNPRW